MSRVSFALLLTLFFTAPSFAAEKKVVILAGDLDAGHPRGTHEYEKAAELLARAINTAPNLQGVKAEVHLHGWPENPATLDDAATIVFISNGSDREEKSHPLLVGDRLAVIEKQMKRGCGLVTIHWSTFTPRRIEDKILEWTGGYFDYESGDTPNKWHSKIQHWDAEAKPAGDHPITRGVKPFKVKEEFYYNIRFRENDARLVPILLTRPPNEEKDYAVAWAVQRDNGGRGFGFTGGHYFANWSEPSFRRMVLNALVWTAGAEVPDGGVKDALPAEKTRFNAVPSSQNEEEWVDDRFAKMETGPFFSATIPTPERTTYKAIAVKLGESGEASVIFDTELLRYSAGWTGGFIKINPARYGLIALPTIHGQLQFASAPLPGFSVSDQFKDPRQTEFGPLPAELARYLGMYVKNNRVVFSYRVGDTEVLDSPWAESGVFTRTLRVGPGKSAMKIAVGQIPLDRVRLVGQLSGVTLQTDPQAGTVVLISPRDSATEFQVLIAPAGADLDAAAAKAGPPNDLKAMTNGGERRWGEPLVTRGSVSDREQALVIDTITMPYENPFRALLFASGHDFFSDGTSAAVCTAHGDVWVVRGLNDKLEKITWQRFATGLFQPLGLRIVGDKVYVLGRDRITLLRDLNNDGEADYYENFSDAGHVTSNGHEYVSGLETDAEGNFYYLKCTSGMKTPHDGSLLRVPRDGRGIETVATGFRNPVGLGLGPGGVITTADQQGEWVPATRLDVIKPGGFYGYVPSHHRDKPPTTYDGPLCWIPRPMDNSAAGQVWLTGKHWGPLENQLVHLSYGRCSMMLALREEVDGVTQGGVVPLPGRFLAGVMRGRVNPRDGHLYLTGLNGWQTSAVRDGCFQRVRYTGKPLRLPVGLNVVSDGLRITFSEPLDRSAAEDLENYAVEQWNYRWTAAYGSQDWSVAKPDQLGHDAVEITGARLSDDGRSVTLKIPTIQPVMQMQVRYNLDSADGQPVRGAVYNTIHKVPK